MSILYMKIRYKDKDKHLKYKEKTVRFKVKDN